MNNSQRICRFFSFFLENWYINFVLCAVLTSPTLNPISQTEYTHVCIWIAFRHTIMITSIRVLGINSLNSIKENNLKMYKPYYSGKLLFSKSMFIPGSVRSGKLQKKYIRKNKWRRDEGDLNWNHFSCCSVEDGVEEMSEIWEAEESKI